MAASTATEKRNFLGIPVEGDLHFGDKRTPQRPLSELTPLMQALLDDPTINSFGWRQYTPYFNDGEPCVFSASGIGVTLVEPVAPAEKSTTCWNCGSDLQDGFAFCSACGRPLKDDDNEDDEYDMSEGVEYSKHLGTRPSRWNEKSRTYENFPYEGPDEARYDRCLALQTAINSGAFNDVLLEHFGDHATVIVTKSKVKVESYDHD